MTETTLTAWADCETFEPSLRDGCFNRYAVQIKGENAIEALLKRGNDTAPCPGGLALTSIENLQEDLGERCLETAALLKAAIPLYGCLELIAGGKKLSGLFKDDVKLFFEFIKQNVIACDPESSLEEICRSLYEAEYSPAAFIEYACGFEGRLSLRWYEPAAAAANGVTVMIEALESCDLFPGHSATLARTALEIVGAPNFLARELTLDGINALLRAEFANRLGQPDAFLTSSFAEFAEYLVHRLKQGVPAGA